MNSRLDLKKYIVHHRIVNINSAIKGSVVSQLRRELLLSSSLTNFYVDFRTLSRSLFGGLSTCGGQSGRYLTNIVNCRAVNRTDTIGVSVRLEVHILQSGLQTIINPRSEHRASKLKRIYIILRGSDKVRA